MKIAFLVNEFPSLSETFILNQITGLLDRGHEVVVFARSAGRGQEAHRDVTAYRLREHTRYFTIPPRWSARAVGGVALAGAHWRRNWRVLLRSLNVWYDGRAALSLEAPHLIAPFREQYDVLHCQYGPNGILGARLKRWGLQRRLVTTFHLYDVRLGLERGGQMYRRLFRDGDCFLAISDWNRRSLIALGLDERKIVYHPVGIDLRRFAYRSGNRVAEREGGVRVLTVARLAAVKGLEYGIRAVHRLLRDRPGLKVRYDIIGGGPLEQRLRELIRELTLGEVVRLLGPKTQEEIIQELQRADIFLLPSLAEGLPVVLMEAQAVGLPVVATLTGGTAEGVLDGRSGFLVPPADVDALADKLGQLLAHPEVWPQMGQAGRRHVEEHFDIERLNDRLVGIYQQVVDGRFPRA